MSENKNYKNLVKRVFNLEKIWDYDLINVKKAFTKLWWMKNLWKIIHIAWTNGKWSVCNMIFSCLRVSEKNVWIYTSPHLLDIRERFVYNDKKISKKDFVLITNKILDLWILLSYFEVTTLIALEYFKQKKADYIILEVGMWWRLDSTNIISSFCTIITSIWLDHQEFLWKTIEEISREKAWIIKEKIPLFLYEKNSEIEKRAKQKKSKIYISERKKTNLLWDFQEKNAWLAFLVCQYLWITEKNILKWLLEVNHRWRLDFIEKNILIDWAHNLDSLKALKNFLEKEKYKFNKIYFCISQKKGKDLSQIFDIFWKNGNYLIVKSKNIMLEKIEILEKKAEELWIQIQSFSAFQIKEKAKRERENLFLIFWSLYMIWEFYS